MMVEATAQATSVLAFAEPKSPPAKAFYKPTTPDGDPNAARNESFEKTSNKHNSLAAALGLFDSSKDDEGWNSFQDDVPNTELTGQSLRVRFTSDRDSGRVAISVIDAKTKEVIREIPSEDIQKVTEKLKENIGQMFDKNL